MNAASLQREILKHARALLRNPDLTVRDLIEWSASREIVREGLRRNEVMIELPALKMWLAVFRRLDRSGFQGRPRTRPRKEFGAQS